MAGRVAQVDNMLLRRMGTIAIITFVLSIFSLAGVVVVAVLNSDDASTTTVKNYADPCVIQASSHACKVSILKRAAAIPPQVACIITSKGLLYSGKQDLDCNLESLITPQNLHPKGSGRSDQSNRPGVQRGPNPGNGSPPTGSTAEPPSQGQPPSGGQPTPPAGPGDPQPPAPGGGQGQPTGGGGSGSTPNPPLLSVPDPNLGLDVPCVRVGQLAGVGC